MKIDKKIVVAALARDCGEALLKNIPRLEALVSYFREAEIVVIENDSRDGTKEILKNWAASNSSVRVISQDFGTTTIEHTSYSDPYPFFGHRRISKMAKYRNIYMDYIEESIKELDYLLMLDIDVKSFEVEAIVESISSAPDNWGALFGYGKSGVKLLSMRFFDLYWDTYAYVYRDLDAPITLKHISRMHRQVAKAVNQEGFHRCASAFGGLGLYRWECIKGERYRVVENNDRAVRVKCEHIPFNAAIPLNYGLYISKNMVVDYGDRSLVWYVLRKIIPSKLRVFVSRLRNRAK